jgi:hypothetical protein
MAGNMKVPIKKGSVEEFCRTTPIFWPKERVKPKSIRGYNIIAHFNSKRFRAHAAIRLVLWKCLNGLKRKC